ncbi:pyruvate kinase [Acetomicrobium thermoterrenum DSM 13490]|uniref:Pyruvate kinase n=1 Tax=Acetomicrobium thermoterrenum DSM 13490 TaxID=1120987 RepID=A0A1H3DRJ3_9BACT|nr:pyruvate kinase [Acetomicrobium thermoterrenum]SDX68269.1 pyruvate kinase [Acetomicrobium thermoterrenum DSM 13490]
MRKVKIVCTLGPACGDREVLKLLAQEGMDVARFNFSHGTYEQHAKSLENIRSIEKELGRPIATMLDTKGPEIRTGSLANHGTVILHEGNVFVLTSEPVEGDESRVSISHAKLFKDVKPGMNIFIDDGTITLVVEDIRDHDIVCRVVVGGELGEHKGINVPDANLSVPALTEKDIEDIKWGLEHDMEYIAVSFVRTRDEIISVRRVVEELDGDIKIIAKIETKQAVVNLDDIISVVDGMMVARGDLGVEMPTEEVPLVQKRIIDLCRYHGKPVIVATQMLDSMIRNPRPTRAEASDVANAVLDGADAVMLSGETAKGKYPVLAVRTMKNIVERVEKEYRMWQRPATIPIKAKGVPDAVSHAAVSIAEEMNVGAILSLTSSGSTARMVSKYRPLPPIIAATPKVKTCRELSLVWGVIPMIQPQISTTDEAVERALASAKEKNLLKEGELAVVTAGVPMGIPGTTNMIEVRPVSKILVKGLSLIKKVVSGVVCKALDPDTAIATMKDGYILVVRQTDKAYVPAMKKAQAIIAEEGGLTSHAAIVALELGIPCIVSAAGVTDILENGMVITVDGSRGVVYQGNVKLH